jgi:threonylcarbamoyladenosine tRNA methylthiotransferase MtaB
VRRLVANGYREVVLTGVDITSYGSNLPGAPKLGALVKTILKAVPELSGCGCPQSIRWKPTPTCSTRWQRIAPDAASASVAAGGRRSHPQAHEAAPYPRRRRRFCEQVRRLRPDVVFGGDIIAGFPTENEAMFTRSLDLVDECGLTQLHVFPFSARPGTPAARMPQLSGDIIKERAKRLREKGEAALRKHLDGEVGQKRRVLTEAGGIGRTEQFTPVKLSAPAARGLMLDVSVAGHDGRQLIAA